MVVSPHLTVSDKLRAGGYRPMVFGEWIAQIPQASSLRIVIDSRSLSSGVRGVNHIVLNKEAL